MAKTFYTERDIDDLQNRGVTSIAINDDVVLTDAARERALKLGLTLQRGKAAPPAVPRAGDDLHQRVKAAVLARVGDGVDPALVDAVIARVLAALK